MSKRPPIKSVIALLLAAVTILCACALYMRARERRERLHSDTVRIESMLTGQTRQQR